MPTYHYACTSCEHNFEKFSSISDRDVPLSDPCDECGDPIRRVLTPVGFNADVLPKHSDDFKYLMSSIKKANRGSNMPDY